MFKLTYTVAIVFATENPDNQIENLDLANAAQDLSRDLQDAVSEIAKDFDGVTADEKRRIDEARRAADDVVRRASVMRAAEARGLKDDDLFWDKCGFMTFGPMTCMYDESSETHDRCSCCERNLTNDDTPVNKSVSTCNTNGCCPSASTAKDS